MSKKKFDQFCYGVTTKCNANCNYCFASKSRKNLDFAIFKRAVDYLSSQTNDLSVFVVGGGENTLEFSLLKKTVEYITQKFAKNWMAISTNGSFNKEVGRFLMEKFDSIQISYTSSFGGVVDKNIEQLKDHEDFSVKIMSHEGILGNENKLLEKLVRLGVRKVIYSKPTGVQGVISNEKYLKSLKKFILSPVASKVEIIPITYKDNKRNVGCGIGYRFNLSVDGEISSCERHTCTQDKLRTPELAYFELGKVDKDGVYINRRKKEEIDKLSEKLEKCKRCKLASVCRSFCYLVNKIENGDPLIPSEENCELVRGVNDLMEEYYY